MRIITGSHRLSHADPLFTRLRTLKIDDLYSQCVRMFAFHLTRNSLPGGISPLFQKATHSHFTRGIKSDVFVSHSDTRSMKHIAPRLWNALPRQLKNCPSVATFKHKSKEEFIRSYSKFVCNVKSCPSCPSQS